MNSQRRKAGTSTDPDPIDPMRFAEQGNSSFSIQSIGADGIMIDNRRICRSVLVSPQAVEDWPPRSVAGLTSEHIAQCRDLHPEVVIIGTGNTQTFPPAELICQLQSAGIGVEVMANDAACRTFNVLLSEDRQVVLALILDEEA